MSSFFHSPKHNRKDDGATVGGLREPYLGGINDDIWTGLVVGVVVMNVPKNNTRSCSNKVEA